MTPLKSRIYTFLRWSERYTKTDMVYVGKNGFWIILGQVIITIFSFTLAILFANYVDKNVYGIYKYILSTAGFLSAFTLTGMNTTVIRAVAQGYDGTFRHSLLIQLKWSLPYFLLSLIFASYYLYQENNLYSLAFFVVAFFGPLSSITNTFNAFLQGKQDFRTSSVYTVISGGVLFLITTVVILFAPSFLVLVCVYFIVNALVNSYFCYKTIKNNSPKNDIIREEDVSYAKHQSLMNIIGALAIQLDNIVVYHLLGPVHLAVLSFAIIFPDRIRALFNSLVTLALPKLSIEKSGAWESVRRKVIQLTFISLIIISLYIIIAPTLYSFLFPEYLSSVYYSKYYALSLILLPSYILVPSLLANRKTKPLYFLSIVLPVIKMLLSIILIYYYGLMGAVIAKIVYDFSYLLVSYIFVRNTLLTRQYC